jgi:membrane protease YdiL (CAAX protease family)
LLFTVFLPLIPYGIVAPGLAEEPAWRGFALPRLQARYGPLLASLILGLLHALWHTPAYFVPATSQLMGQLLPPDANELLARFIPVVAVLIVIAATRGRLSFRVDSQAAAAPSLVR